MVDSWKEEEYFKEYYPKLYFPITVSPNLLNEANKLSGATESSSIEIER